MKVLLVDYGASRIKAAIYDVNEKVINITKDYIPPQNDISKNNYYEISSKKLHKQFNDLCNEFYIHYKFNAVVMCSQMHGFIVLDEKDQALTNYISWQDERSLIPIKGLSTFNYIDNQIGNKFKNITGMKLRPCFPYVNLLHLGRENFFSSDVKIISMPEWLSMVSHKSNNVVHETMAAGLGIWDINTHSMSNELAEIFNQTTSFSLKCNKLGDYDSISGYWDFNGIEIPIYCGIGDHQCALLGTNLPLNNSISINIGTGSQVSFLSNKEIKSDVEIRPYFDGQILYTITHIPAGRVLNVFIGFIDDVLNKMTDEANDVWSIIRKLTLEELLESDILFDLALFKSAYNYNNGGKILQLRMDNFNLKNYISSLIRSLLDQYIELIQIFDVVDIENYIISGGIPLKIEVIKNYMQYRLKKNIIISEKTDETITGLTKLADKIFNRKV